MLLHIFAQVFNVVAFVVCISIFGVIAYICVEDHRAGIL